MLDNTGHLYLVNRRTGLAESLGDGHMKKLVVAAFAAAAFCGAPANAETPNTFTGYYAGVQGGYAFKGMVGLDLDNFSNTNQTGGFGGGQIGGNWQNGYSVFGVNLNYNGSHIHGSKDLGGELYSGTVRSFGTAEIRLGRVLDPASQLFASAGMAFGSVNGKLQVGGNTFSDTNWMTGFTLGGGYQRAIDTRSSWTIQYKYVNFGSKTFTLDNPEKVHFSFSSVELGYTYRY